MINILGQHAATAVSAQRRQVLQAAQLQYAAALETAFGNSRTPSTEQLMAITTFQTSCLWADAAIVINDPIVPSTGG